MGLYRFGRQLGLAFQVVDDILDFTGSDQQLGKPAASDLASGYLTAPTFYAMEEHPSLQPLIDRQFSEPGDLDQALEMVRSSTAIERTRELAETFARESRESIAWMPDSAAATRLAGACRTLCSAACTELRLQVNSCSTPQPGC